MSDAIDAYLWQVERIAVSEMDRWMEASQR